MVPVFVGHAFVDPAYGPNALLWIGNVFLMSKFQLPSADSMKDIMIELFRRGFNICLKVVFVLFAFVVFVFNIQMTKMVVFHVEKLAA